VSVTLTWPRTARCGRCDEPIILARHDGPGRPIQLDEIELLPRGRCGPCRGKGHVTVRLYLTELRGCTKIASQEIGALEGARVSRQVDCYACNGTGIRGDDITPDVVILDAQHGIARRPDDAPRWQSWESFHRRHRCTA
jgi:hypothetical protein